MNKKTCFKCKKSKALNEFYKRSSAKDGLQNNCKDCKTKYNQSHYKNNINAYKNRRAEWRELNGKPWQLHNLDKLSFEKMIDKYNGNCWICKEKPYAQIDHDHRCCSGANSCGDCVRGLLCVGCNTALGKLGDSLESIMVVVNYLKDYESK